MADGITAIERGVGLLSLLVVSDMGKKANVYASTLSTRLLALRETKIRTLSMGISLARK